MAHFKQVTSTPPSPGLTNAIIMGRKTWDSIPPKFRPLEGRVNVVLSRKGSTGVDGVSMSNKSGDTVMVASSLEEAMQKIKSRPNHGATFIIGGGEIYSQAIKSGLVQTVIYTNVKGLAEDVKMDTFFPELSDKEWECIPFYGTTNDENDNNNTQALKAKEHKDPNSGLRYEFLEYIRRQTNLSPLASNDGEGVGAKDGEVSEVIAEGPDINPEEMQYLEICRDIMENGVKRGDRTGTGTLSKFGVQMRFSLRDDTLPLLTTKRSFWRGVAEELLWFIKVCLTQAATCKWSINFQCATDISHQ